MKYDLTPMMTEEGLSDMEKKIEFMKKNKKRIAKACKEIEAFLIEFQKEMDEG